MDIDIDEIRRLVELMVTNDLSRVELREGESVILLRRGQPIVASGPAVQTLASPMPASLPVHAADGAPASTNPNPIASAVEPSTSNEQMIRSPMVGTFYASPDQESPAFIKVGDLVGPDTVVCLIEAMKVFNEIKAEVSGRITKVLVKNAQAVEFDQPLFAVASA